MEEAVVETGMVTPKSTCWREGGWCLVYYFPRVCVADGYVEESKRGVSGGENLPVRISLHSVCVYVYLQLAFSQLAWCTFG